MSFPQFIERRERESQGRFFLFLLKSGKIPQSSENLGAANLSFRLGRAGDLKRRSRKRAGGGGGCGKRNNEENCMTVKGCSVANMNQTL